MSNLENLKKNIQFMVCGELGDPLKIEDQKTGETARFARVLGIGKTYNLSLDTEEELKALPAPGTPCRAIGILGRRSKSIAASARITNLLYPGQPGWKDLTDEEVLAGGRFWGWGMVGLKKDTEFNGKTYRSFQIQTFGETFQFKDVSAELLASVPDDVALYVEGTLDSQLNSTANGTVNDLILHLARVSPTGPAQRSARAAAPEDKQAS